VLGRPLRDADRAALETVQIADLQAAAARCENATRGATASVMRVPASAIAGAVALFGALAALAIAFPGPRPLLAGAAAIAAGLAAFLVSKRRAARAMRGALAVHSAGMSALVTALGELHVAESRIAHLDQTLVGDIEQLRIVTREHALSSRRLAQLEEGELRAAERGATLAAILGTDDPERLSGELEAAQRRDAQATAARERLAELEPRVAAASDRARLGSERLSELESLVRSASPTGEGGDALERLHAASTRRVAADQREHSLVEGVPELDALLATARDREARGECLVLSDDEHATLVAELREARARAEGLMLREQELSAELARLAAVRTVGDVEGELRAVEDELAAVRRERDRLVLAAAVVRRAEREVRERYAPAWLQSASRYLDAITNGRYTSVAIVETPGGEPVLEVTRAGEAMPVRVGPPLSRGTLEQIYVAVRLALVDAIDAEARLPMFLDELFAHWDAHRLDALVRVLGAVEGRQVVVSTCHAALADRLERACGARVIELAGPDGAVVQRPPRRLAVATAAPEQEGPTLLDLLEG
jgi:DNA repair exonuclease SbcCD ATPase subunit